MKYKVSFYENLEHLLTERKANFVHKLKGLTTKITNEMMKQIEKMYDFKGTTGDKLIQFLLTMTKDNGRRTEEVFCSVPINGKNIPINFKFVCRNTSLSEFIVRASGNCLYFGKRLHSININILFALNEETVSNTEAIQSKLINKIHNTLVHELAHAHDENLNDESDEYKDGTKSKNDNLAFMTYWLKPTEIRSHFNEVLKGLSSTRHINPKRVIKNYYKDADKAASREENPVPFTQDYKNKLKQGYSNMLDLDNSRPSYDLAVKALDDVVSSTFSSKLPQSQKQFLIDYHIAFARDYSPKMKERYYDPLFKGYEAPSLEQMNKVFDEMKSVFRGITRIQNALKKKYYSESPVWQDKWWKTERTFKEWENVMWDNPKMSEAMKSNDPKKLKKAAKDTMELFKSEMGIDKETLAKDEEKQRFRRRGRW